MSDQAKILANVNALSNSIKTLLGRDDADPDDIQDIMIEDDLEAEADVIMSESNMNLNSLSSTVRRLTTSVKGLTHKAYDRLQQSFFKFCETNNLITQRSQIDTKHPVGHTPDLIIAWIMENCDNIDWRTRSLRVGKYNCYNHGHAAKMRTAISKLYGHHYEWRDTRWDCKDGKWCGNPALSVKVSEYLTTLGQRKVENGETTMSSRSITYEQLRSIHSYIADHPNVTRGADGSDDWAGLKERIFIYAAGVLSFICLLRSDEVLNLRWDDVRLEVTNPEDRSGKKRGKLTVTLKKRKTHKFGNVKPFVIYHFDDVDAHLCPVTAMWYVTAIYDMYGPAPTDGYVFRRFDRQDNMLADPNAGMTPERFLDGFRHSLIDIGEDPLPYASHSFRRGGCQWLSDRKRWPIRKICDWGGWSLEFSPSMIIKYLFSWNDNSIPREEFFHPDRKDTHTCPGCGKSYSLSVV